MFILKSILGSIQSEFQESQYRGKLFVAVLLAILIPASFLLYNAGTSKLP